MSARNTAESWGWMAKALHWLVFLFIVGALVAVFMHDAYPKGSEERAALVGLHKSFGAGILALMLIRLVWRVTGSVPNPEPAPKWQLHAATLVHWALYAMLLIMPLSGVMMSEFAGRPVSFFGLFEIPIFVEQNKELAGQIKNLHEEVFAPVTILLIAGHVAAALWHHFITKDNALRKMLPFSR